MVEQTATRKILLSTVGSRGDVQPLLALAVELRDKGFHPVFCVGPNFKDSVESFGFDFIPLGLDLSVDEDKSVGLEINEQNLKWAREYINNTMETTLAAARDCAVIIAAGAFQYVAPSVAELLGITYRCAVYCPSVIPTVNFPPPHFYSAFNSQSRPKSINKSQWISYQKSLNAFYLELINLERNKRGLSSIGDVHQYVLSAQPWLATDKVLAPDVSNRAYKVTQTSPWILTDDTPLPKEVEDFLQSGEMPVYIGFGSMKVGGISGQDLVAACDYASCRAIIYGGWGELEVDTDDNILLVGALNHSKLFPKVKAVVHHGGGGTTTAAAIAGIPQLIVPHIYDQFYWGNRVKKLGIGLSCRDAHTLSSDALAGGLRDVLQPERAEKAQSIAKQIDVNGAKHAAQLIAQA